jgi:hypothetical protein
VPVGEYFQNILRIIRLSSSGLSPRTQLHILKTCILEDKKFTKCVYCYRYNSATVGLTAMQSIFLHELGSFLGLYIQHKY